MFKKIQESVAKQTRDKLGFVQINRKKGRKFVRKNVEATDIPQTTDTTKTTEIAKWEKNSYLLNREKQYIVPVHNLDTYHTFYPDRQYLLDYYNFWDIKESGDIERKTTIMTQTQKNGSLVVRDIPAFENTVYSYHFLGNGRYESVNMSLESNHIAVSVWAQVSASDFQGGYSTEIRLLYSSDISGLTSKTNFNVPIGSYGTDLFIFTYNHYSQTTNSKSRTYSYTTPVLDSLQSFATNTYISIETDVTERQVKQGVDMTNINIPVWGATPITASVDPITGNVITKLSFKKQTYSDWRELEIYRGEVYSDLTVEAPLDNKFLRNNLVLSTSTREGLDGISYLTINGQPEKSIGSMMSYGNGIVNSDFSAFTSNRPTTWTYNATSTGSVDDLTSTVYAHYGNYIINGNSLRLYNYETVDTTKSQYIETGYLTYDTSKALTFCFANESTPKVGAFKALYFTSTDGTYSSELSSVVVSPIDGVGKYFNQVDTSASIWNIYNYSLKGVELSDASYVKFRFYGTYETSAPSSYIVDAFHYGTVDPYYFYHTSESNKVVLQMSRPFDKARNYNTVFNLLFDDTTKSINSSLVADTVAGQPYYISAGEWDTANKFEQSISIFDSSHSWIKNGDFSGGLNNWSTSDGFRASTVAGISLFNDSAYIRLTNDAGASEAKFYQTLSPSQYATGTPVYAHFWLKSRHQSQKVRLSISNSQHSDSSTAVLTNTWNRYTVNTTYDTSANTTIGLYAQDNGCIEVDVGGVSFTHDPSLDFVITQSTASSTNKRSRQYLRYQTGMDYNFGTIRLWYTPLLDNSTGHPYNSLLFYGATNAYKSIYYDRYGQEFHFRQYDGTNYRDCVVATSFSEQEPIHIVATWNTADAYLYVNKQKSDSAISVITSDSSYCYVGYGAPSLDTPYCANGFISNFRFDRFSWDFNDIVHDFNASDFHHASGESVTINSESYIGSKSISGTDNTFQYTDDNGLEVYTTYSYVFRAIDSQGNASPLSSAQTISIGRMPYEYNSKNKVMNSLFEVNNSSGNPRYWHSALGLASATFNTDYYFRGSRSIYLTGTNQTGALQYDYVAVPDTSASQILSFYALEDADSATMRPPDVYLGIYDNTWNLIGEELLGRNEFSSASSTETGLDGNTWKRYHTTVGYALLNSATVASMKYISLQMRAYTTQSHSYFDAVQFQDDALSTYREGYYVDEGNFGPDVIDGNAIRFGTLVGNHLRAGELIISGSSSDGNRIIIGKEESGESFSELTNDTFRWHSPGQATSGGYKYAKHIEFDENAPFDETIGFTTPFYNFDGSTADSGPKIFLQPFDMKVYDKDNASSHQSIKLWVTSVSATSFRANAQLKVFANNFNNLTLGGHWSRGNEGYVAQEWSAQPSPADSDTWGTTTFPTSQGHHTSIASTGTYRVKVRQTGNPAHTPDEILVYVYCTSVATTAEPTTSTWRLLGSWGPTVSEGSTEYHNFDINSEHFSRARSIAGRVRGIGFGGTNYFIGLDPQYINYATAGSNTILDSGSGMGKFAWLAIDGGAIG